MNNFSDKVQFIWSVADLLRGPYKPAQYGRVILPLTVLRRLDCVLAPTKDKVLAKAANMKGGKVENTETELPDSADRADYEAFKKMLDRVGKAISMSNEGEVTEIIRRRLFEWHGLPEDGRKAAAAYAEWARDHAGELANMGGENIAEPPLRTGTGACRHGGFHS